MRVNRAGTLTSPNLATAAHASVYRFRSAIDGYLDAAFEAQRALSLAVAANLPGSELGVLRALVLQRNVNAFEQFAKRLVSDIINETGQYDDAISAKTINLKYILDHGVEGLGYALLEREVLGNVAAFRELFASVAKNVVKLDGSTADMLADILQLRHTIVHHLGIVTKSDARKFVVAALKRADRAVVDDVLLRDIGGFLEWIVRSANDNMCAAVCAQHRRRSILTGIYANDKRTFASLIKLFYCTQDDARPLTRVLPSLYREYVRNP